MTCPYLIPCTGYDKKGHEHRLPLTDKVCSPACPRWKQWESYGIPTREVKR